ncbi:sensor histidine kinase [Xanthovirga aplysinae]|uniref:sensor histidine kinase n=1 Tax=Xanthovirga aplysinae TaxID=2529853 RepID=UPI0012BC288F|nr:histidine kinase [Xanthovirga aplysinae]MTI33467.1 hypothetical protein [Xanthovirga aplysinae]
MLKVKNWWKPFIASGVGLLVFTYLYYSESNVWPSLREELELFGFCLLTANISFVCIHLMGKKLNHRFPWGNHLTSRLLLGLFSDLMISFFWIVVILLCYEIMVKSHFNINEFIIIYQQAATKLLVVSLLIFFMYEILSLSLYSYQQYAEGQIESVKLKRQQLELQIEVLKSQLSPHYLFNCLNTISSLVDKDADLAEEFIRRLSYTYQYILETNQKGLVKLSDEMEFLKSYNFLLKVRYANSIDLTIDLSENAINSHIPPLSIQMLMENAVKHNEISERQPLNFKVYSTQDSIVVSNNRNANQPKTDSIQIGLKNIQNRYAFYSKKAVKIIQGESFEVSLPIINEPQIQEAVN